MKSAKNKLSRETVSDDPINSSERSISLVYDRSKAVPGSLSGAVDMEVIDSLNQLPGVGSDFLSTLIQLFVTTAAEKLTVLDLYLLEKDFSHVRQTAHTLKSSCGNIGAFKLAAICQELETMAKSEMNLGLADHLVHQAREEFFRVRSDLDRVNTTGGVQTKGRI